jgi:hypothetical protein
MKTIINSLSVCFCFFIIQESQAQKMDIYAFKNPKDQSVICRIKNNDTLSYYIPNDPFLCDLGDTLFVEAVFKQKKTDDPILHYFQFNPPQMDEIEPGKNILKRIDYKSANGRVSFPFLTVRIYKQKFNYDMAKDSLKYHSYANFLVFEQIHSFVVNVRIENLIEIANW